MSQVGDSRTLTVVLSEADWRALREVEPDAVGWLQARIQERLGPRGSAPVKAAARVAGASRSSGWNEDVY